MNALPNEPHPESLGPELKLAPKSEASKRGRGLVGAAGRLVPIVFLGVLPVALAAYYLAAFVPHHDLGLDFRDAFWPAAHAVLHGHSPYPALDSPALADRMVYAYPPIVAILLTPLGALPVGLATTIAVTTTVAALGAALWVMGVRDWRCYGISLASPVVLGCMQTAALSGVLALGVALAWRHRAHGPATPLLIVAMIAAKLFLWPLLIWLAIVRGTRTAALAALGAAAVIVAPWLAGFPGGREYPSLLARLTELEGAYASTPRSLALALGAGPRVAQGCAIATGLAVLLLAVAVRNQAHAHRRTLALTLLASLLLSPLVWFHYLAVLLPPMALASQRFSVIWLTPLALWFAASGTWTVPTAGQITVALGVMTVITVLALRTPRAPENRQVPDTGVRSSTAVLL